jgi:hypothetical protein
MKTSEARSVGCHATSGSGLRLTMDFVTCCRFVSQDRINSYVTILPELINTDLVL